jgi:hypothetical protein
MTPADLLSLALSFNAGPPPTINQFILDEDDPCDHDPMRIESRGVTGWAICDGRACINRETDEMEYEPMPSSRTEAFIARTRFASPTEAFAFLDDWKARRRAEAMKRPGMIQWKDHLAKVDR